jgi:hypothetical protein
MGGGRSSLELRGGGILITVFEFEGMGETMGRIRFWVLFGVRGWKEASCGWP